MNNFLIFTLPEQANALSRPRSRVRAWGRVPVGGRAGAGGAGLPEAMLPGRARWDWATRNLRC